MQDFCKHQNGENGICGTPASLTEIRLAFAEVPQALHDVSAVSDKTEGLHSKPKTVCPKTEAYVEFTL